MQSHARAAGRLRILVGGYLGLLPTGGVTWDYIQYPLGLAALGHDVYYLEDTGMWPIYQSGHGTDCAANVTHLASIMDAFELGERWAYRDEISRTWFGPCANDVDELVRSADVLLNISCSTYLRDEYRAIPVRALIDSDPMFTQIQYELDSGFTPGHTSIRSTIRGHTHHFTFGESIGATECRVPSCGVTWRPTRQPICLDAWPLAPLGKADTWTTVMNWSAGRTLQYQGESWGQKDVELQRIIDLPAKVPGFRLALAVASTLKEGFPADEFRQRGWRVCAAASCVPDWQSYRNFIKNSFGEFSVAKETYVKARTGWFSCRSACYLAAGRPVVAQDTGWSAHVAAGYGLLAFHDLESAVEALQAVEADPARHAAGARALAEAHFDSRIVLRDLLSALGA
jgi:hypothetical protein